MKLGDQTVEVRFAIRRFHPERDERPHWQEFSVSARKGMTVLDALHQIREEHDATLSWRSSCRMGVCGSCGMVINGVPRLACSTQVLEVSRHALRIEPLWNFDIVKDLVTDQTSMFAKHASIEPYLVRADNREIEQAAAEWRQAPTELTRYLQFSYCIKCGLCMAACPTVATDASYLGPMPLTAAQRYNTDSRDRGAARRKIQLQKTGGAFSCHFAGECSRVCPKGVDPARAIQWLKRDLVFSAKSFSTKNWPPRFRLTRTSALNRCCFR